MTLILAIENPYVAEQSMERADARKAVTVRDAFVQMTGGDSLLAMAEHPGNSGDISLLQSQPFAYA